MTAPTYLTYVILAASIAIILAIVTGASVALKRARWPDQERNPAIWAIAAILVAWFLVALTLGLAGVYRTGAGRPPVIQFGLLIPIIVGAVAIWRSSFVSRMIDAVPQHWIIAVQFYRVLGVILLVLYAADRLPGWFALPAGIGDVCTGLLAPLVALAYLRDPQRRGGAVLSWNLFGLGDLVVAVTMGLLTSPSPLQLLAMQNPNELITAFPLVLIPTFGVPLSVLLHFASLVKLARAAPRPSAGLAAPAH